MIGNIGKKLDDLGMPVEIVCWDGASIGAGGTSEVRLSLKSQMAALSLSRPTLDKLTRAFVRGFIDIEVDARQILGTKPFGSGRVPYPLTIQHICS